MAMRFDRRQALIAAGSAAFMAGLLPRGDALAAPEQYGDVLARLLDGREPVTGGIDIEAPEVAEDGNMVPVAIRVASPMTEADHVRRIVLLATRNPVAEIATYHLSLRSGEAFVASRVRLSESQDIVALAELADGTVRRARREVRVTVGGCGAV